MNSIRQAYDQHPIAITVAVGGSAVLLSAVAVLLLLNVFGTGDPTAVASPTVVPGTSEPSLLPSLQPSPSEPEPSATEEPANEVVYGDPFAVEATADVALVVDPADAAEAGHIPAGEIALIVDGPVEHDGTEWLLLAHGETQGWVAADDPTLVIHRSLAASQPAQMLGLDAGPTGFVAWGIEARATNGPSHTFTAVSTDGRSWQVGRGPEGTFGELFGVTIAGGPNGWIMLRATAEGTGLGGAWRSDDGITWESIQVARSDGGEMTNLVPFEMLGHPSGYVLVARDDSTGTSRHALLTSADGLTWEQREMPEGSSGVEVGHLGAGFMAWTVFGDGELAVRFSPDGDQWLEATGDPQAGPRGHSMTLVEAGGVLVAATTDVEDGSRGWWTTPAPLADRAIVTWTEQPTAAGQLAETGITKLLHIDGAALAIGRRFDDGTLEVWRTADGASWAEMEAAALTEANASTWYSAGAESGAVVVGYGTTDAGPNPIFLASSDGDGWASAAQPALPAVESSVPGACPDAPRTMVEWQAIPGAVGAECFDATPITFTAFSTEAGGCGGFSPGFYDPTWLASPFAGDLVLLPFEAPTGGCGGPALDPSVATAPEPGQWLRLTGHWADPAAQSCTFRPDPRAPTDPFGADVVFHCRTVFVVADAEPAGLAP